MFRCRYKLTAARVSAQLQRCSGTHFLITEAALWLRYVSVHFDYCALGFKGRPHAYYAKQARSSKIRIWHIGAVVRQPSEAGLGVPYTVLQNVSWDETRTRIPTKPSATAHECSSGTSLAQQETTFGPPGLALRFLVF